MPRLVPDQPLPSYSYVPGGPFPHPVSAPAAFPTTVTLEDWRSCRAYLFGIDLFNAGYYWEAHEAWEELWRAAGRRGTTATFLKGLIKLAAAGVKVREGVPAGVTNHARRAAELFEQVRRESAEDRFLGLDLDELKRHAQTVADKPPECAVGREAPAAVVFDFVLRPA